MIPCIRVLGGALLAAASVCATSAVAAQPGTTSGTIAVENLDYLLTQPNDPARRIELLLAKSRFLGDYDALDEAVVLSERLPSDAEGFLLRARTYASAHRFSESLTNLHAAAQLGVDDRQIDRQRAVVLIATGRVVQALATLEFGVESHHGYAIHGALASAHAELGRYQDADREYRRALASLTTTSPFPYAWTHFALGWMWAEQAGDANRGEIEYRQALAYLPQFAAANIHLAEIEIRRGDLQSAQARLMPIAEMAQEPEALALLGSIERKAGREVEATRYTTKATQRYRSLLARMPLALADHAAEFFLAAGGDTGSAFALATRNLENRGTPRAFALAIRAAVADRRNPCHLVQQMRSEFDNARLPLSTRSEWERWAGGEAWPQCGGRRL